MRYDRIETQEGLERRGGYASGEAVQDFSRAEASVWTKRILKEADFVGETRGEVLGRKRREKDR